MEEIRAFHHSDAFPANVHILDSILTCRKLNDLIGDNVYLMYQHIKTAIMVSNRCCLLAVYSIDTPDGGFIHMTTSKGNKAIEQANLPLLGKDVLSHTTLTYSKFEPIADGSGCRITAVLCVDPAGSLPYFVKNKIAA